MTRLVGEMYSYRLLDSNAIMRVLYTMVPKASGVWGRVVPITHVPAHLEARIDVIGACCEFTRTLHMHTRRHVDMDGEEMEMGAELELDN